MKSILIDSKEYNVQEDEFHSYVHPEYNNLKLYHQLADIERVIGLLQDLSRTFHFGVELSSSSQIRFGGYLYEQLSDYTQNKKIYCTLENEVILHTESYMIIVGMQPLDSYIFYSWKTAGDIQMIINVHPEFHEIFQKEYHWYITPDSTSSITFDNLIHLVMIVKNAGEHFSEILEKNIPHIDRWTIIDTGSTDQTVEIIQRILAPRVRGQLFQEPFIDFGTTRNRALELAGKICKFTLMLDDTYYIVGDLRGFLNEVRSDQFADSFSLYVDSDDVQYTSNRIVKTARNLKYIFKIHEVIQEKNNVNVIVPVQRARIHDKQSDYMQKRTRNRKSFDLELLRESIREDPDNPRHYYYMAQTYVGMENWEMAYKFFLQRVYHSTDGFLQEKIDACFEAARTAQFRLNRPWSEVQPLYKKAYEMDPTRPDALYFLGIYEYLHGDRRLAYKKFKQAFEIGYPLHAQYSLKPTLSFHFVPKFLTELCYEFKDYPTGEAASRLYLEKNAHDPVIGSWYNIYRQLNRLPKDGWVRRPPNKPYLCFVADGNWNKWTGKDIESKGLGGSETYIVEMARWIQQSGFFQVVVFCRCSMEEIYEGVQYYDLEKYYTFIQEYIIHTCIISRYSEYIPVTYESNVENIYFVFHDLVHTGIVIPIQPKLKRIFVLSSWHKKQTQNILPTLDDQTTVIHYGIHSSFFQSPNVYPNTFHRFIYSSFPNRGLHLLLEMWPEIRRITGNQATLAVYSDIHHPWSIQHYPQIMNNIQKNIHQEGIIYHGWVNKETLAKAWLVADVWLYPCVFEETFCLTALEAAASRTLVITNDLAALQDTVGDRGMIVPGDAKQSSWKNQVLRMVQQLHEEPQMAWKSIDQNYEWALTHSWKHQADQLLKIVNNHPLEYRNMYNWTSDVPAGSRNIFQKIVQKYMAPFVQPLVLEIGTWSGTSIIGFLNLLPQSLATVIDPWEDYHEFNPSKLKIRESFEHNIRVADVYDRITIHKSTSVPVLLELIQDHMYYHLIYVDGSHQTLDVYADLILCWKLLVQNGLLIIDDYLWKPNGDTTVLDAPRKGIDHFLQIYKSQMRIVYMDYRVFIQKIKMG